jgi:predicted ArsR family transcriptional regulator
MILSQRMLSPAGIRILKLLAGRSPQSMADMVESLGVTRTAIVDQLNDLQSKGHVERIIEPAARRGRPCHRYETTPKAMALLSALSDCRMERSLWQAIHKVGGETLINQVADQLAKTLTNRYCQSIDSDDPAERLYALGRLLESEGVLVEFEKTDEHLLLKKRNCPLFRLMNESCDMCEVGLQIMRQTVDQSITRTACWHEGDPCCIYKLPLK